MSMQRVLLSLPLALAALATAAVAEPRQDRAPVVPGLQGSHGLDRVGVGEVLFDELRCGSCHASEQAPPPAPKLDEVAVRTKGLAWLERYLADPAATHPGSKMPSVLPDQGREQIATELAHYLLSRATTERPAPERSEEADRAEGERLFHSVGCVACHDARVPALEGGSPPQPRPGAVPLDHVGQKYDLGPLAAFLFQPLHSRPSGRMPDLQLKRGEARAIASYLLGEAALEVRAEVSDPALAEAGERHYRMLGCVSCHETTGAPLATPRDELDPEAGCLSDSPPARYGLDGEQRAALAAALGSTTPRTGHERIAQTFAGLNCISCHARGDAGGVSLEIRDYFSSDEPELGEDARIPPPLTDVGAKLTPEWLHRVLHDGVAIRPYMHTRMPGFGDSALEGLPELLAATDEVEPYPLKLPTNGDERRLARDTGRKLLGTTGGACVSCHNFNGRESLTYQGPDLITTYERLQPDWFARFLISPQTYRPGIVMPESWPGGVSVHADLDGSTEAQLSALWYFLSLGTSAPEPDGLRSIRNDLVVTDRARTYRGRSSIAGYRGIAVGFPGGMNYAFNAQNGALSALWKGRYVNVRWQGQGAGGFNPSERAIQLAQDTTFHRLGAADEPWPLRPRMTEENPVDPDPLYPKNLGYRFRGYTLDGEDIPTFEYMSSEVRILDRSAPEGEVDLRRVLTFEAPAAETLHMRLLTGAVEDLGDGRFAIPRLAVKLPPGLGRLRPSEDPEVERELILTLELPAGTSQLIIDHDLLD